MKKLLSALLFAGVAFSQSWPGAVVTNATIPFAVDHSSTILSSPISNSTLIIPVISATTFRPYEVVNIDSEQIQICSVSIGTLTACVGGRGYFSTAAVSHNLSVPVYGYVDAGLHNTMFTELQAVESWLSTNNLVNFLQPATGAVSRTIQSKLADVVSVKDFGAKMDGTTDDSIAFQACVNTTSCYIPEGTLAFASTINLPLQSTQGTHLYGASGLTNLKYTGSSDALAAGVNGTSFAASGAGLNIENFILTGTSSATAGIHLRAFSGFRISNVHIVSFLGGDGFFNEGANTGSVYTLIADGNKNGIHEKGVVAYSQNFSPNAVHFFGGEVGENANWNVWEDAALSSVVGPNQNNSYIGMTFELGGHSILGDSATGGQLWLQNCDQCTVTSSYFEVGPSLAPYQILLGGLSTDGFPGGNIASLVKAPTISQNIFLSQANNNASVAVLNSEFWNVSDNIEEGIPHYFINLYTSNASHGTILRNPALAVSVAFSEGSDSGYIICDACQSGGFVNTFAPSPSGVAFNTVTGSVANQELFIKANSGSVPNIVSFYDSSSNRRASITSTGALQFLIGTGSFILGGTPTATRNITIPDTSGSLALGLNTGVLTALGSISSQSVGSGACVNTGALTLSGFQAGQVIVAVPNAEPGAWFVQHQIHTDSTHFQIEECNVSAASQTINAVGFYVRIIQ
jgi:hypothetical protein